MQRPVFVVDFWETISKTHKQAAPIETEKYCGKKQCLNWISSLWQHAGHHTDLRSTLVSLVPHLQTNA
ncbi:Rab Proteins Geranylgeranyltransferase Component A 2 [Manis pentadactyla]|nr:Rab Proteins Geranylgeranyltransferase Component A 2 [Manis pentadactyla]